MLAAFDRTEPVINAAHVEMRATPVASARLGLGEVSWQDMHRLRHLDYVRPATSCISGSFNAEYRTRCTSHLPSRRWSAHGRFLSLARTDRISFRPSANTRCRSFLVIQSFASFSSVIECRSVWVIST